MNYEQFNVLMDEIGKAINSFNKILDVLDQNYVDNLKNDSE